MRCPTSPEVSVVFLRNSQRRWAVVWKAPYHLAIAQFTTRAEAIVVANRLVVGPPSLLHDGKVHPARDPATIEPWNALSIEDALDAADALLEAALAKRPG